MQFYVLICFISIVSAFVANLEKTGPFSPIRTKMAKDTGINSLENEEKSSIDLL